MDKTKKKKVQMPSGIRSKLTAAIAMLLISSLLVVGSTYAWFTLSTAPEVTGITTSVGANGNLEIALLNGVASGTAATDTFADMSKIQSAVGNSSEVIGAKAANVTWGNLVDLSDASYGLTGITLLPSAINGAYTDDKLTSIVVANLLKTPVYGVDGRVADLDANTVSAVYSGSSFTSGATQTYGVRAVGVSSNLSARQIAFNSAKGSFTSNSNNATAALLSAISMNQNKFGAIALNPSAVTYNYDTLVAVKAVAQGADTTLKTIVNAYSNAALAAAAAKDSGVTDENVNLLKNALSGVTSANALLTALNNANIHTHDTNLGNLVTAQTSITNILNALDGYIETAYGTNGSDGTPADNTAVKDNVVDPLIDPSSKTPEGTNYYLTGGVIGQYIAAETGNFELATAFGNTAIAGAKNTTGALATLANSVNNLTAPDDAAESNITDFYGYVVDFAFRTNASSANLQLQTAAANRVYTDGSAATQGGGSTVTFTYNSALNATQAETLMNNIKLVFFNPDTGAVYTTAGLTGFTNAGTSATAKVTVDGQAGDVGTITALSQNTATKVSVLVYLDGTTLQNKDVANAASSGSLALNLQFSSSVPLQPMQNTALKTKTVTP